MYAYKDRLADGFDKGLTNSMLSNSIDDPQRTIDFNWMQRSVNILRIHTTEYQMLFALKWKQFSRFNQNKYLLSFRKA